MDRSVTNDCFYLVINMLSSLELTTKNLFITEQLGTKLVIRLFGYYYIFIFGVKTKKKKKTNTINILLLLYGLI